MPQPAPDAVTSDAQALGLLLRAHGHCRLIREALEAVPTRDAFLFTLAARAESDLAALVARDRARFDADLARLRAARAPEPGSRAGILKFRKTSEELF